MRGPFHDNICLPDGRAALLLVDIQDEQRSDPAYNSSDIEQVVTHSAKLLGLARENDWSVAHAQYVRDFSVKPQRPFEAMTSDGGATFSDVNSDQVGLCREVAPQAGEPVFTKNDASAFDGTKLHEWLQQNRIEWLIVCGVWTDACIAATVRNGTANGYRVLLVKDACGSGTTFMHQTAILNLANRLYGGGICDTARAAALLAGQSASVWRMIDPVPHRFTQDDVASLYDAL
jgi:nicotinamidase-related amidase